MKKYIQPTINLSIYRTTTIQLPIYVSINLFKWLGRVSSRAQICPSFSSVVSICSLIHYLPRGCKYAERVSRSLILFARLYVTIGLLCPL